MISDIHVDNETEYSPSDLVENIVIINATKTPLPVEVIPYSDSSFSDGIVVGVVIGIAIGIAFIFIIRQKPPKWLNKVYKQFGEYDSLNVRTRDKKV